MIVELLLNLSGTGSAGGWTRKRRGYKPAERKFIMALLHLLMNYESAALWGFPVLILTA
jgi:hypothetical protein